MSALKSMGSDAEEADALAAARAVSLLPLAGLMIVFEGDALGIIKALQAEQPDQSRLGNIIKQAKHQAPLLRSASFVYVPGPGGWGKR